MHRHTGFKGILTYVAVMLLFTAAALEAQRIPRGTAIVVRNTSTLSSGTATVGQRWSGTLVGDLSSNGRIVARSGSRVRGRVTDVMSSGRLSKPGEIALEVTSVNGIAVNTDVYAQDGEGHTKSNVAKIGGGTAAGALLGGIFGGGKGAAIGALVGGGAGTAGAAATGKKEAKIEAESTLTFTVQ